MPPGIGAKLEVAAAASEAISVSTGDERLSLAHLSQAQLVAIAYDAAASPSQKAQAEFLQIKLEKVVAGLTGNTAATSTSRPASMVTFFHVESQSRRIVYIVDHSGSMLDNYDFLKHEVMRSINALQEDQLFGVALVSDKVMVLTGRELVAATYSSKGQVGRDLSKTRAEGQNDGVLAPFQGAFEAAFKLRPDTIYFLTDGAFGKELPALVKRLNVDQRVHLNTIAFITEEPEYKGMMEKLAKDNGGVYKFIPEKDLAKP